jgi:hypothetical protein
MHFTPAQELMFEKPAHLNDLPSSETYQIMCDAKGYIWFSTEKGVCRYNGQELKIFRAKEGIPEEICYSIVQDPKGIVYVITSKNRILELAGEKFVEIPVSIPFSKQMNKIPAYPVSVGISGDSVLLVSTNSSGFKVNVKNNKVEACNVYSNKVDIEIKNFYGLFLPIGTFDNTGHMEKSVYHRDKDDDAFCVRFSRGNESVEYAVPIKDETLRHRARVVADTSGNPILVTSRRLVQARGFLSTFGVLHPDKESISAYVDKTNGLWLGTRSRGIIYYPNASDLTKDPLCALEGFSVACITEDKEGNIWCTTLEDGIYCCRNKEVRRLYENRFEKIKSPFLTKCVADSTFLFTGNGPVLRLFGDRLDTIGTLPPHSYLTCALLTRNRWLVTIITGTTNYDYHLKSGKKLLLENSISSASQRYMLQLKSGRIFGASFALFSELTSDYIRQYRLNTGGNHLGLLSDSQDGFYMYTAEKLLRINYSDPTNIYCNEYARFPNILKIIVDSKDRFWVITKGSQIYTLKDGQKDSMLISSKKGEVHYYDVYEDACSNIWFATNFGLLKLSPARRGYMQEWFDETFGLPDVDFQKITGTLHELVVSTSTEVLKFPLNSRLRAYKMPVPVYISSVRVNEEDLPVTNHLDLSYDQNTIEVKYDILDYNTISGKVRLRYKVTGYDEDLHELDHSDILLTKLPPGEFRLLVSAADENGSAISGINELHITIHPPFWKKWPFIILTSLCGFALIIFIVFLVLRRSRKKLEEKNRIDKMLSEYQMSALKAQMNPHFIFNCINSIQRYILTNKTSDAYDYLAKFSKLIRLVLNYSEDTLITLEEELEICQLYIEMEQIRYEGFFMYEIICAEHVKKDTVSIPSLLLQPYIENAIWHGIMNLHKSREGRLSVRIYMEGEDLKITIEDNGVGREKAARMRDRNHKSKALGLNRKRMELINLLNNSVNASVIIEDLSDAQNNIQGTRVKLTIPQINKND